MARKPPGSAIFRTGASLSPSASLPSLGGGIPSAPADINHPFFRQRELLSVPTDVVQRVPQLARRLARWDRARALSLLAGLQLEPRYHANHLRLTWATRLVLGLAQGDQRIGRSDLMRLVNADLGKADLLDMEDPIEDFFLSPIATRHGEIPILNGVWSHPAFYADCLVEAFVRVARIEDSAPIGAVDALLALSRAVAARAGLARRIAGDGIPKAAITLPANARLDRLASYVRWTPDALRAAGISADALDRFVLNDEECAATLAAKPANAPLDFKPLVRTGADLLLAAPSAISMAARAAIADHMLETGREAALAEALLAVQAERLSETRFAQTDEVATHWGLGEPIRSQVFEYSAGRYLHLEQIVGDFANWRERGFGEPWPSDAMRGKRIVASMLKAHDAVHAEPGFCLGTTLYLMGGWGKGERIDFARPDALEGWRFMGIEVADAIALSGCVDGALADFWRIDVLADMVRRQGFGLQNLSGPLNLFQWWKETSHTLVPQHARDVRPPIQLAMPTDSLFAARQEGMEAYDRRTVARPGGGFRPVVRLDPMATFGTLEPIYISYQALRARQLVGVTLAGSRPVWLQIARPEDPETLHAAYQNWAAALQWLALVMPLLDDEGSEAEPVLITLELAPPVAFGGTVPDDAALDDDITVEATPGHVIVRTGDAWQQGARRIDNGAEIALAGALLEGASGAIGRPIDRPEALRQVRKAVPSSDVRWRHAYEPERAADVLRLHDILTHSFREIPRSVVSLIKHGHAFGPERPAGTVVSGKEDCAKLLAELHGQSLATLLASVAHYDRTELVTNALAMMQAAIASEQHWALTARALRGIHGHDADLLVSLAQRARVNAVLRASAILIEVAASHAPETGGMRLGEMDYDELSATALHHFGYCELVPSLAGDRLTAKLIVSPTGDLLYDHSFGDGTLAPSAAAMHAEQRQRHIGEYGWWLERTPGAPSRLGPEVQAALRAEFCVTTEEFGEFSSGLCDLAIAAGCDVLLLRRSELLASLGERKGLEADSLACLVDRLILPNRAGWDALPSGAYPNDYDLGRFDRPQSLIGRPLVAISDGPDPMLAIGPAAVERSFLHNLSGVLTGSLQDRFWSSKEMRSHVGRAANRAGMAFNDSIAEDLRVLGLQADASVAPWACLNHKATPTLKLFGDIDVLAFSADRLHAWVIEAKDIKLCRTLGETARRLSDYRGQRRSNGKPDNLLRHLDRVAYVRAHAADLAKRMKLDAVPEVHGLVVVDTPQPMIFVEANPSPDARFVRRRDLTAVEWAPQPSIKRPIHKRRR
jgi:hypothetical protein